jgi:hypothetical protein
MIHHQTAELVRLHAHFRRAKTLAGDKVNPAVPFQQPDQLLSFTEIRQNQHLIAVFAPDISKNMRVSRLE